MLEFKKEAIRNSLTTRRERATFGIRSRLIGPWQQSEDNPNSASFVPLEQRGELEKAIFWAMQSKRRAAEQTHGEF